MIVHKFGGTSLGAADRIRSVAGIIDEGRAEVAAIVVSAVGGVTDRLIAGARAAARGDESTCNEARSWLSKIHHDLADDLLAPSPECGEVHTGIDVHLALLDRFLDSMGVLGELSAKGHDAVAGFGEMLCAALVAAKLREQGAPAQAVNARELIQTDARFGAAVPDLDASRQQIRDRILPLVEEGTIPIITGYIGATADGIPTTLGRSGSDFSAAIIASSLDSDELRIWTDVDGILTADPNVVRDARVLRELSYKEAARLARFGAEVLHPRTIGPIVEKRIPLSIVNSFNPQDRGTRIVDIPETQREIWPAIVSADNLQLLRLRSEGPPWGLRSATAVLSTLDGAGIPVRMFSQSFSEQGINLVVGENDGAHCARLLSGTLEHLAGAPYYLETIEQVATVSVIGLACTNAGGIASSAFAALGSHGVRVVAVAQEASEDSVTFCISAAEVEETVRSLHNELGLASGIVEGAGA